MNQFHIKSVAETAKEIGSDNYTVMDTYNSITDMRSFYIAFYLKSHVVSYASESEFEDTLKKARDSFVPGKEKLLSLLKELT